VIKVLVVDDSALMRKLLGGIFSRQADFELQFARNGLEALELLESFKPDVVTLDIHMPQMDGLAATRAIKALNGAVGDVPIIAMSADALPQQVERCYAAGMVDHVAKPVQREVLYAKVSRWLART